MKDKDYIVYLLYNTCNNKTYLGITNNSERRIRQHNGEIKGGARYTTAFKGDGCWKYYLKISNLDKSSALSIERTAKNLRKKAKGKTPIEKRVSILKELAQKYNFEIIYY